MRIGIIQPFITVGDFSRNVRAIIEAYRACLDQDADLIIAPAHALEGPLADGLRIRSAFPRIHETALDYLSSELSHVPLITLTRGREATSQLILATNDSIQRFPLGESGKMEMEIGDVKVCVQSMKIDEGSLTTGPLGGASISPDAGLGNIEVSPRLVALSDNYLFPGGSSVSVGDKVRPLPMFRPDEQVVSLPKDTRSVTIHWTVNPFFVDLIDDSRTPGRQLRLALKTALEQFIKQNGYTTVALLPSFAKDIKKRKILVSLLPDGLDVIDLPTVPDALGFLFPSQSDPSLSSVAILSPHTLSDQLHLSPEQQLLDKLATLHPFGDLTTTELLPLTHKKLSKEEKEIDIILSKLLHQHDSATDLEFHTPYPEHTIRSIQRKLQTITTQNYPVFHFHGQYPNAPIGNRFGD